MPYTVPYTVFYPEVVCVCQRQLRFCAAGNGIIVHSSSELGLVVVDRSTASVNIGNIMLSFGGYPAELPARVRFLHPLHNFAILSYDPSQLSAQVRQLILHWLCALTVVPYFALFLVLCSQGQFDCTSEVSCMCCCSTLIMASPRIYITCSMGPLLAACSTQFGCHPARNDMQTTSNSNPVSMLQILCCDVYNASILQTYASLCGHVT